MLDLINVLDYSSMADMCDDLAPVLKIVGTVVKVIWILVPIILIIIGSTDMMKAVTEKDEKQIKDAQSKLLKRAIAAGIVFLLFPIVGVLMTIVGSDDYEACMDCIKHPYGEECPANSK